VASFAALPVTPSRAAGGPAAQPMPDFTQGGKPDASHDWTLGPTGARGWIHTANGHSRVARQILVTAVAKGSPADGVLSIGDVILGVGSRKFAEDARIQFAKAIAEAESERGGGELPLLRWRDGKSEVVELKLPVLGSYSATAPYDCPKSQRIFEQGCASLAQRMVAEKYGAGMHSIPRSQNALALLASGNKDYLPLLRREAKWAADFTTNGYLEPVPKIRFLQTFIEHVQMIDFQNEDSCVGGVAVWSPLNFESITFDFRDSWTRASRIVWI
jgi:hypothetical protein